MKKLIEDDCKRVTISKYNDTFSVRFQTREYARVLGFGPYNQARISLAAGEMAQILFVNCVKHPELIISGINENERLGVQVSGMVCLSIPEANGIGEKILDSLHKLAHLVDETVIENQVNQSTHVSITQWQQKEALR